MIRNPTMLSLPSYIPILSPITSTNSCWTSHLLVGDINLAFPKAFALDMGKKGWLIANSSCSGVVLGNMSEVPLWRRRWGDLKWSWIFLRSDCKFCRIPNYLKSFPISTIWLSHQSILFQMRSGDIFRMYTPTFLPYLSWDPNANGVEGYSNDLSHQEIRSECVFTMYSVLYPFLQYLVELPSR